MRESGRERSLYNGCICEAPGTGRKREEEERCEEKTERERERSECV